MFFVNCSTDFLLTMRANVCFYGGMSYITRTSTPDEKVEATFRPHWVNYIFVFLCSFTGLFFLMIAAAEPNSAPVGVLLAGVLFVCAFCRFIKVYTCEYAITNKRAVAKVGFIFVNADELKNSKIESVEMKQSILGRILGYATLCLSGVGTSRVIMKNIESPYIAKRKIEGTLGD